MIRTISGTVTMAITPVFVVETNGVGYEIISTTLKTQVGVQLKCAIFTVVKEDSLTLYGFNNESERGLFALLISVNGVGPKSALTILAQMSVAEISQSLEAADPKPFQQVKGIGKKAAERIVLDLAGSINRITDDQKGSLEISSALQNLGYTRREYQALLKELPAGNLDQQLTWALSKLAN